VIHRGVRGVLLLTPWVNAVQLFSDIYYYIETRIVISNHQLLNKGIKQ